MAGLLDGYGIDPMAMGLLGAGGALLTPRQQGGGIGAALQAFPQGMMQGQLMQQRMQMDAMRAKLIQSGIDENEAQAIVRKAMAEKQMADQAQVAQQRAGQQSILGGIASGQQPGFRDASIAMGGTAPAGYQPPGQRNPITQDVVAKWMSFGGDPDVLKKLAESGDWGRRQVARVLEQADAQGRPTQQQYDKFGQPVGAATNKPYEKKFMNTGGSQVGFDPFTLGLTGQSIANTMTPDGVASNKVALGNLGVAQANLGLSRQRLEMDRANAGAANGQVLPEQGVVVDRRTGVATPIKTPDGSPLALKGKPLPEGPTKQIAGARNLQDAIVQYQNLLKSWNRTDAADPAKRSQIETAHRNLMLQGKEAYNLGVLNGPDLMIMEQVVTSPTSVKGLWYGADVLSEQATTLSKIMQGIESQVLAANPGARVPPPAARPPAGLGTGTVSGTIGGATGGATGGWSIEREK
jgi:YD repeat-containing protein